MERITTRAADAAPAGLKTDLDLRQAAILGLLIGLWIGGPVFAVRRFLIYGRDHDIGQDAHAYWLTARIPHLYTAPPGTHDAFLYSPAFAQIIRPIAELPFGWFVAIMIAIDAACYAWLLAPLGWKWAVPLWFFLAQGYVLGNVIGLLTVAAVLGIGGRSGWWAIGYLTKVSPGLIGASWHAARGEWHQLVTSWVWTGAIVGVSYILWPAAWHDWLSFLSGSGNPFATARLVCGLILVAVGGRRGWWWVVPVGLVISAPVFGQGTVGYLAGLIRLRPGARTTRPSTNRPAKA
jgi:hypothetical protein